VVASIQTLFANDICQFCSLKRNSIDQWRDASVIVAACHDIRSSLDQVARRIDVVVEKCADQWCESILLVTSLDVRFVLDQQLQQHQRQPSP
jgi:hypothetical protein